jgi:hypothetical protein
MDLTVHTHNISLGKIAELFEMPAWVLGIQPAYTSFGEGLSRPVREAARSIIHWVNASEADTDLSTLFTKSSSRQSFRICSFPLNLHLVN